MLLKFFYDNALAHASYLIGCQRTGEALIIDPGRDIQPYLDLAAKHGMRVTGVAETHIHADYVSGARELADRVGAKLFVSDEGPQEWKYEYVGDYDHQLLRDGDVFGVGAIELKVMHTPGHTPESISLVLTDRGGGADQPMGIFTGDFVFVGSIGRPDLLEEAAGIADTAEPGARDLFRSIARFRELPDYLQVWPAHGAGSACGKGLGAIPSSTVGYEKRFNPALQIHDEQEFVDYILSEQPEAPKYFALMKRVNKEGPLLLGDAPLPPRRPANEVLAATQQGTVIDTSPAEIYREGHVPGSIYIGMGSLAHWAGSVVDYERPVALMIAPQRAAEAVRILRKIGVEQISGWFDPAEVREAGYATESTPQQSPSEIQQAMEQGELLLVDVRGQTERDEQLIEGTSHHFLGKLPQTLDQLDPATTYAFHCRSGVRSTVACSLAQQAGLTNVINLEGGIQGWESAGLPTQKPAVKLQASG